MLRYLCAKHSMGGLYPTTLERRFDAERWYAGIRGRDAARGVLDLSLS